jgi:pimeloyl-ACP methyl ester carboxylesterase
MIDRPIVVGHSMSGALASIYAASYPTLGIVPIDQPLEIRPFARMVQTMWPALSGSGCTAASGPFQQSIGLDRIPEPIRSRVLATQDIRQNLVLGYWEELNRTDPDAIQARINDTARHITRPYLAVFGRALSPQSVTTRTT